MPTTARKAAGRPLPTRPYLVQSWLSEADVALLDRFAQKHSWTRSTAIQQLIQYVGAFNEAEAAQSERAVTRPAGGRIPVATGAGR